MAGGAISRVVERGVETFGSSGIGDARFTQVRHVATMAATYSCNLTITGLKPAVYRIQSESRVSLFSNLSSVGRLPSGFILAAELGLTGKEYVKTKESIPILGRQVIRLLLQAGIRTRP